MSSENKRVVYVLVCLIVLLLWITQGSFEAIESPYTGF